MQAWIYLPAILSRNLKAENCVLLKVLNRLKKKKERDWLNIRTFVKVV